MTIWELKKLVSVFIEHPLVELRREPVSEQGFDLRLRGSIRFGKSEPYRSGPCAVPGLRAEVVPPFP